MVCTTTRILIVHATKLTYNTKLTSLYILYIVNGVLCSPIQYKINIIVLYIVNGVLCTPHACVHGDGGYGEVDGDEVEVDDLLTLK